jgi:hypothetical protein
MIDLFARVKKHLLIIIYLLLSLVLLVGCSKTLISAPNSLSNANTIVFKSFPAISKWMLQANGTNIANFLDQKYNGKLLQEPINVIIIDAYAVSLNDADTRLQDSFAKAGYKIRLVHSNGYKASIAGITFNQQPKIGAYSNNYWFLQNNHGRVFGPYFYKGKYFFIAAFSSERLSFRFPGIPYHQYVSFKMARSDLAAQCINKAGYTQVLCVNMHNKIPDSDTKLTTGDHDGFAIVLLEPQ